MKDTLTAIFIYTSMIIASDGQDCFNFPYRQTINKPGTIKLTKRIEKVNDSTCIRKFTNSIIIYKK